MAIEIAQDARGLVLERVAYRPLRDSPRISVMISAIGASFVLLYSYRGLFGSGIYAYPPVPAFAAPAPIPLLNLRWIEVLAIVAAFARSAG